MDEKEAIKEIRWQLSKGKSRAEITRNLQKRGLKLEFIDSLIYRAKKPKKIIKTSFIFFLILISFWTGVYAMFFYHNIEKIDYTPSWELLDSELLLEQDSLKITPELISLVASELGANKLRTNPLNFRKPVMNFIISEQEFHTIVDKKIQTFSGKNKNSDLNFYIEKEDLEKIFSSENTRQEIINSIQQGSLKVEKISSDQELFLKGYMNLYNDLK